MGNEAERLKEIIRLDNELANVQDLDILLERILTEARKLSNADAGSIYIRDGDSLVRAVRRAIPLSSEHKKELLDKFATVIRATVKGNLLVAAIQGALGGIAFWFLGVGAALLCGVLMAFLSLLPAVGAALVWFPVAVYFFVVGAFGKSVALFAYGVLVIGLVDNLLRPILVGKDTRMPDYVVMITTLGGMAVFGINGFVLGPTIAAMFIAVWHIYIVTRRQASP